ncbi:MAG: hypothetical protein ACLPKB_10410 [Xanthobacteraceae bacterium]
MSLIVPRPTVLRVLDALRWSRVAWSSAALAVAFAAGGLAAGILAKPPANGPTPIAMVSEVARARDFVPTRSRKTAAAKHARKLPAESAIKRETISLAAVDATAPSATSATAANAQAAAGEARAQDQTSASTTGEAPLVAIDAEQSDDGPAVQDADAAQKAMKEARRAKRLAKHNRLRSLRALWAYADRQSTFRQQEGYRAPSFFLFGRFDNRNM